MRAMQYTIQLGDNVILTVWETKQCGWAWRKTQFGRIIGGNVGYGTPGAAEAAARGSWQSV